ncbi:SET domain-containing protein [Polychaeton citri CBS 116435]|uniref:SET domain-containing protein n=1 Tax=Polychaeton citri CBS 116435 TaxID=1314669 RepID=A0A9P4Q7N6_9PEZI|nr:SET domain-containing protein [Polychaeton citri CBS 116435]
MGKDGTVDVDNAVDAVRLHRCPHLELRLNTHKGRGVFATSPIAARIVLEISPVLILDQAENKAHIEQTELYHYTYNWPLPGNDPLILGLGSMFNHSRREQNVVWQRDVQRQVIVYRAARDIAAGEELCISYGDRLTFVDADEVGGGDCETVEGELEGLGRIEI